MSQSSNRLHFLRSDLFLGALVAILSVMTAFSAYQGSLADSKESDLNVEGDKMLSESNTEFLRVNQEIIYDYDMYDGYYIQSSEGNEDLTQYYQDSFSDNLLASMERPDGPFDEQYYDEMFLDADTTYQQALDYFDQAQAAGDRADNLQLVVLMFAVSLALGAYGSLVDKESILRPMFGTGSLLLGIVSLIMMLVIMS
jgi:hypothetical protein